MLPQRSALILAPSYAHCFGDELGRSRGAALQRHNLTAVPAGKARGDPLANLVFDRGPTKSLSSSCMI